MRVENASKLEALWFFVSLFRTVFPMKMLPNGSGCPAVYSRDQKQFFQSCFLNLFQASEMPQQYLPPFFTHTPDIRERRTDCFLLAQLLVIGYGKPVCLIADPGKQQERRGVLPQHHGVFPSRQKTRSSLLAISREVISPLTLLLASEAAATPVTFSSRNTSVRTFNWPGPPSTTIRSGRSMAGGISLEPAGEDFIHHGIVIGLSNGFYAVMPVIVLVGHALQKGHLCGNGKLTLDIGNVVALDPARNFRQMQPLLQLFQSVLSACFCAALLHGGSFGVSVGQLHQVHLVASAGEGNALPVPPSFPRAVPQMLPDLQSGPEAGLHEE